MKNSILAIVALSVVGCSAKYNVNNIEEKTELLMKDTPVSISVPANGMYGNQTYTGSGKATAMAIREAFSHYTDNVNIFYDCGDLSCLNANHKIDHGYYVVPQILHWEDRATEWSGLPDRITIKIVIYSAESNRRVAATMISGKSKWATFGGDHPQDLLAEPVNSYVAGLY
ncbi:DUF4823 domain-containing protein [Mangrovibacter phragmitis]|uniref:DUF4823 domain-containing protein n=1 Tax=Mangrovibacter phragmitis TaxID=1691903 RepID=A0A1B7L5M4_9ENTR|nr:DUF4823 domain-containing protein [Mangrovibacter phragmitis]OAT77623.1 DUF4823 domain-containing protein [Mangrovibacter phragmitis]